MSENILEVSHLTHFFKLNKKIKIKALDDVSFQIKKGEIFGLVGESGSGKSTLARCVMNIYKPSEGKVFFEGIDIYDKSEYKANRIKLQTQRQFIFFFKFKSENEGRRHHLRTVKNQWNQNDTGECERGGIISD